MKEIRVVDEDLLAVVRKLPCIPCMPGPGEWTSALKEEFYRALDDLEHGVNVSMPHHLSTRGAGGDDVWWNCIPVCDRHHKEFHDQGIWAMAERYKPVEDWLVGAKWKRDVRFKKWLPPKAAHSRREASIET